MSIEPRPAEYGTFIVSADPETGRIREVAITDGVDRIKVRVGEVNVVLPPGGPNALYLRAFDFKTSGIKGI